MEVQRVDARLARIACLQHGVFSRTDARASGFSDAQIDRRVAAQMWVRVLPRVYRHAATPSSPLVTMAAAVAWAGAGCALSHETAAALWRLGPAPILPELLVPARRGPVHPNVIVHRTSRLDAGDTSRVAGLPVTVPLRTLCDLASTANDAALAAAVVAAIGRGLIDRAALSARRGAGAARLRRIMATVPETPDDWLTKPSRGPMRKETDAIPGRARRVRD